MIIKQSTARTIIVGPVLDSTGAAKTDEVVASIKITKNGTVGAADGSTTLTHDHAGKYKLAMAAGDTDTLGVLEISLNSGTNDMPVKAANVVPANVYDSLVAGSASLAVDAIAISGDTDAANNLEAAYDGTGYAGGTIKQQVDLQTVKGRAVTDVGVGNTVYLGTAAWSTLTQAQVSGGAYDLTNSTFVTAFKAALGTVPASGNWSTHAASDVASLILVTPAQKVVTDANGYVTYSNAAPPSAASIADAVFDEAVLGHTGFLSTLLVNTTWTDAKAAFLDAAISSRSTYAGGDTAGTTTLLTRCTEARLAELDAANLPATTDGIKTQTDKLNTLLEVVP